MVKQVYEKVKRDVFYKKLKKDSHITFFQPYFKKYVILIEKNLTLLSEYVKL